MLVDMVVKKFNNEEFKTEYEMPIFDRVDPAKPIEDVSKIKIAIVELSKRDFTTIHGGYDRAFVLENPNLVVPLDVVRELENEGVIGEVANYFVTTTGTGTSVGNAKRFGEEFVNKLVEDKVDAVILTST